MIDRDRAARIEHWVFDLDNTLYPRSCGLFVQVDQRISGFVARLLELGQSEAEQIQRAYYKKYGTTLRGLMEEHGIEPGTYLDDVHDIDYSSVAPNAALKDAVERLPGKKYVLTNGTADHARRVTDKLGITEVFSDMFDIVPRRSDPQASGSHLWPLPARNRGRSGPGGDVRGSGA